MRPAGPFVLTVTRKEMSQGGRAVRPATPRRNAKYTLTITHNVDYVASGSDEPCARFKVMQTPSVCSFKYMPLPRAADLLEPQQPDSSDPRNARAPR